MRIGRRANGKAVVIGQGFIGLPTAAMFADHGWSVTGVDAASHVVDTINAGKCHFSEPGLDNLVSRVVSRGTLRASTQLVIGEVYVITIPLPVDSQGSVTFTPLDQVAKNLAPLLVKGNLIVLETTCPPGTTERFAQIIQTLRNDLRVLRTDGESPDLAIAHCPERVIPGNSLNELIENTRMIGGLTPHCAERAASFYESVVKGKCIRTNARTAELIKLVENTYRDVSIAFANELSTLCDSVGADVWEVIRFANQHPRVKILQPGIGVGGPCVPMCSNILTHFLQEKTPLISLARRVNENKTSYVIEKIKRECGQVHKPVLACFGLTFRPNIPDIRESPAVSIVRELVDQKVAEIRVVEPHLDSLPEFLNKKNVSLVTLQVALEEANVIAALVYHNEFSEIPGSMLKGKRVVDPVGMFAGKTGAQTVLDKAA